MTVTAPARIIAGGLPRSGTTLLGQLVDQAGVIVGFHETSLFVQSLWQLQATAIRRAPKLAAIFTVPPDEVVSLVAAATSQTGLFDVLWSRYCENAGVTRSGWMDKTPRNCEVYPRLAAADDTVVFVSVIRHGLDVVTSRMVGHARKAQEYWCPIQRYVDSMSAILAFTGPRHLIVRYEDLVADPARTLRAIHDLAGVPLSSDGSAQWSPLSPDHELAQRDPLLAAPIDTSRSGRWADPEHADRVAEFMARDDARHFLVASGYDLP